MHESYSTSPRASTSDDRDDRDDRGDRDVREAAHEALANGISVLPPKEDGTKAPLAPRDGSWKRYQAERATPDELAVWYGTSGPPRRSGLGAVCGAVSGNLEFLEFDRQGMAYEPFKAAAAALGLAELMERIEAGYLERSPSGGVHWGYRCEVISGSTKLAQYESDELDAKGRPIKKPLIETKGEGGYIILAPTNGKVHPTGGAYELIRGGVRSIATITPEERGTLWDLARTFDEIPHAEPPCKEEARARKEGGGGGEDTLSPIDDYNARASWPDILPAGWALVYRRGDTQYWRRPGKDRGVSATINRNGSDRLFVFSTSAGFDALKPYSKFDAHALLSHGGDFKAAFHALSQAGYGTFKAWVWEESAWVKRTMPNPCPAGGLVRIARPGAEAPPPPRGSKGKAGATAEPSANGKASVIPPAEAPPEPPERFRLTDLGNAERLRHHHGHDLRHCHPWGQWLEWDGRRWAVDQAGAVKRRAKDCVRRIYLEAASCSSDDERTAVARWAMSSESRGRIDSMIALAASEPGLPVQPAELDRDPWVLNVQNGTIDLKSGFLGRHLREDLITKLCPVEYDPDATCPLWESTLRLVFDGSNELVAYWQTLCGLMLTGIVSEQYLPILYGKGSNGKTTVVNALLGMLGPDYAMKAPPELLMVKRGESHPTERAALFGKRLVVAIETEEGGRLNETMVKELTGSDPITARRMREDFWTFQPTHKVLLCTNHKPAVRGTDHAIWRRLRLVPFTVTIPEEEAVKDMPDRLAAEFPGILTWCVRGCQQWHRAGRLVAPDGVKSATEEYRQEQDTIGEFLAEHCLTDPSLRAKASDLYACYQQWTERSGEFTMSQKRFGTAMSERGFERIRDNGKWYLGLGLRSSPID